MGRGSVVLDIGCGPGAALEAAHAAGAEVSAVDPSPGMVKRASRRVPEATVKEGSAEKLDFPDDTFTHVWTVSAYHHWAHPDSGIAEARRVLAPGGRFLIVENKLKAGKTGHGMDRDAANAAAERLATDGFSNCEVDTLLAGRKEYLVVAGRVEDRHHA